MKKIIANKTGRWAQADPSKKQIDMTDGSIYDESHIPLHMMDMLVSKGFAHFPASLVDFTQTDKVTNYAEELDAIVVNAKNEKVAKKNLETWGIDHCQFIINKRRSIVNIIDDLIKAATDFDQ